MPTFISLKTLALAALLLVLAPLFAACFWGGGGGEEEAAAGDIPVVPEEEPFQFDPVEIVPSPAIESMRLDNPNTPKQVYVVWDSNIWVNGPAETVTLISDKGILPLDADAPLTEDDKRMTLQFNIGSVSGDPQEGWPVEFLIITLSEGTQIMKEGADPLTNSVEINIVNNRFRIIGDEDSPSVAGGGGTSANPGSAPAAPSSGSRIINLPGVTPTPVPTATAQTQSSAPSSPGSAANGVLPYFSDNPEIERVTSDSANKRFVVHFNKPVRVSNSGAGLFLKMLGGDSTPLSTDEIDLVGEVTKLEFGPAEYGEIAYEIEREDRDTTIRGADRNEKWALLRFPPVMLANHYELVSPELAGCMTVIDEVMENERSQSGDDGGTPLEDLRLSVSRVNVSVLNDVTRANRYANLNVYLTGGSYSEEAAALFLYECRDLWSEPPTAENDVKRNFSPDTIESCLGGKLMPSGDALRYPQSEIWELMRKPYSSLSLTERASLREWLGNSVSCMTMYPQLYMGRWSTQKVGVPPPMLYYQTYISGAN